MGALLERARGFGAALSGKRRVEGLELGGEAPEALGAGHGLVVVDHGADTAADTRNGGTSRDCGNGRPPRDFAETPQEARFRRLARTFLKRNLPVDKPAVHLAPILKISDRQAYALLNGSARWTLRHVLRLLRRFPDFVHAVLSPIAGDDSKLRPRFRRRRAA